jgi:hypothetical protein
MDTTSQPPVGSEHHRRRLGEVFVELGFVTGEQLDAALEVQRTTGGRVGEILIERGSMTRLDLASALIEYWEPTIPERGHHASLRGAAPDAARAGLAERLDQFDDRIDELAAVRCADAVALGVRLRGAEVALDSLGPIEARLSAIERRLDELGTVGQRFDSLLQLVGRLHDALDTVAGLHAIEHPVEQ